MKLLNSILCALLALSLTTSLSAITSYVLIQAPNGKFILILGDVHQDNATIRVIVEELKKARLIKPLPVVVELNENLPLALMGVESVSVKSLFALQDSFKKGERAPITLSRCEPRGDMSDVLEFLRKDILAICKQTATEDQLVEFTDNLSGEQKTVAPSLSNKKKKEWNRRKVDVIKSMKLSTRFADYTVGAYKKYLETNRAFLVQCRDRQKEPNWRQLFDAMLEGYAKTGEEISKNLRGADDKKPLVNLFVADMMACETVQELLAWSENWYRLYIKRADYSLLESAMHAKIADSLSDTEPLCLLVGEAHACMMVKDLTTGPLGCKLLEGATIFRELSLFVQNDCEPGSNVVKEFEAKLLCAMQKVLEPLKEQVKCCASCSKAGNLKACSSCKKVYYCGIECQKKAWKEHKSECEPVKVKVKN